MGVCRCLGRLVLHERQAVRPLASHARSGPTLVISGLTTEMTPGVAASRLSFPRPVGALRASSNGPGGRLTFIRNNEKDVLYLPALE